MPDDFKFLGRGFDTFKDERCAQLLNVETKSYDNFAHMEIHVCTSEEEIFSKLDVNAKAGYHSPTVDFDVKASFAQELASSRNAVTILAVATQSRKGDVTSAKFIEKPGSGAELYKKGGDSYIWQVQEGGQYIAAYQFLATTSEQKRDIKAEVDMKITSFDTNINVHIEDVKKTKGTKYSFTQTNIGGKGTAESQEKIFEFAAQFTSTALENPALLHFKTRSYVDVDKCPEDFNKVEAYTKAYNEPRNEWRHSLAAINAQATITMNQCRSLYQLYKFYGCANAGSSLDDRIKKLGDLKWKIKEFRQKFSPTADAVVPSLDISLLEVPEIRIELVAGPTAGRSGGGHEFEDFHLDWIYSYIYPKKFLCHGGNIVDSIDTTYARRSATNPDGPDLEYIYIHNGGGGPNTYDASADFGPGEICNIKVWWWPVGNNDNTNCVSGFEFTRRRNNENQIFPFRAGSKDDPAHIEWGVTDPYIYVGLKGHAGTFIDGVQPMAVKFSPPVWHDPHMPDEY